MSSFLGKLYPIAHWWWINWSNYRWKNVERFDTKIDDELLGLNTYVKLSSTACKMYKKFKWTADGADQLFDSICPPPYNYKRYKDGLLEDDCDGFHSLMLHIFRINGIESYLMSVVNTQCGHCILLFKFNNKWYTLDYNSMSKSYENVDDCINAYNDDYASRCNNKKTFANGFVSYNYEKGKWENKLKKELK